MLSLKNCVNYNGLQFFYLKTPPPPPPTTTTTTGHSGVSEIVYCVAVKLSYDNISSELFVSM